MEFKKFAAIDIGSNAVRLLVSNVFEGRKKIYYRKSSLIRIPIRLGLESFSHGKISAESREKLVDTMIAFSHLIKAQDVLRFRGTATSAMREASNGPSIVAEIKKKSGIDVEIIDGKNEARILYASHMEEQLDKTKVYLYVDVGGGSTELTIFADKKQAMSGSFNIGTLRILNKSVKKKDWETLRKWVEKASSKYKAHALIGSGGNINRAFKMARTKEGKFLSRSKLNELKKHIQSYSMERRIVDLDMRPDRADVIIPALTIFIRIMEWSKCSKIFVPKMGLADGLVRLMYEEYKKKEKTPA